MIVECPGNKGIGDLGGVNFTFIRLLAINDILIIDGFFASFFGSGRASDLNGLVVPDRGDVYKRQSLSVQTFGPTAMPPPGPVVTLLVITNRLGVPPGTVGDPIESAQSRPPLGPKFKSPLFFT